jgi:MFS family permease
MYITSFFVIKAWIGSASTGVQYICCILGSILTDLFGARRIGLLGGLISTISLAASAFIENIMLYFFTYGFGFGIGQALLLSATLSILPHYFKKRLSLANGLMVSLITLLYFHFICIQNNNRPNYEKKKRHSLAQWWSSSCPSAPPKLSTSSVCARPSTS